MNSLANEVNSITGRQSSQEEPGIPLTVFWNWSGELQLQSAPEDHPRPPTLRFGVRIRRERHPRMSLTRTMSNGLTYSRGLPPDVCQRAVNAAAGPGTGRARGGALHHRGAGRLMITLADNNAPRYDAE